MDLKMEVYTPALELIGFLEIQRSVIWAEKAFTAGSFSVESLITRKSLTMLQPGNIIWIEGETAGIIKYIHATWGEDGPYITAKGPTLTGILDNFVLFGLYNLKGTVPEIMHYLVNDCCINPTRGNIEARKIPGLVSLDAPAGGDTIQIQRTGTNLLELLRELGQTYNVPFGIRFNPAVPQMEFWTRWGQDRTIYQDVNQPVLYSTELDDVLASEYLYNAQDYRNVAIVAGEGEGAERVYVTVENEDEPTPEPVPPTPPDPPVVEQYTVTLLVDPSGGGIASGGKTVVAGTSITVTATPSDGYDFIEWRENGEKVSAGASYTFTVNSDRTLTAVFAESVPTYTITATVDPSGSGNVTGTGQYQDGATVNLKATANDGYTFGKWRENGATVHDKPEYSFMASRDVALTAAFAIKPKIPDGYTLLEYIESPSTMSGIDTGVNINYTTLRVEMDIMANAVITTENLLGAITTGMATFLVRRTTDGFYYSFGSGSGQASGDIDVETVGTRLNFALDMLSKEIIINSKKYQLSLNYPYQQTANLYFLRTSSSSRGMSTKIYSAKIYDGDILLRDFVPCSNQSGVAGLYDLAEKKFYQSAWSDSANAPFKAGPAA